MNRFVIFLLMLWVTLAGAAKGSDGFGLADGSFMLNGQPFVIKAAELHYPRIPHEYWAHRIRMCKALGMNTICLYVFWNFHEERPDEFDFSGQKNLREFIKLCDENEMKVILRPGPYVCAEWEMGGLPWWLLKHKDVALRESDSYFLDRVDRFQRAVAAEVADMTIDKGGPIIMIQVENEYGSYGIDKQYISQIRDMLRRNFGESVAMFQCDWSSNFLDNGLDDLIWTLNFGTGADIDSQFAPLREARKDTPLMCSEFWSGWFDKWGASHETRPAGEMVAGIDEMLSKGISFSLYMTHGGTNWGHWAGANSPGYAPDVTSYDYDAPISENGEPTPKYDALRAVMARYAAEPLPEIPPTPARIEIASFEFTEVAELWDNLPEAKHDVDIHTMEEYDQGFGSIIYSTTLPAFSEPTVLRVDEAHDFAQIFIDGTYVGTLDRRNHESEIRIPPTAEGARLDMLVEAMGRINFGRAIKDFKGITGTVSTDAAGELRNWTVYNLPDSLGFYNAMKFKSISALKKAGGRLPRGVYRGKFVVEKPGDTFLNFETWGKGLVYVNGHALGRIWQIGPQQTLYVPGCWLREGENDILVFDIIGPREARAEGLARHIIDKVVIDKEGAPADSLDFSSLTPIKEGQFQPGGGWKRVQFDEPATGRYLCVEAVDALDGGDAAAIAEIYLVGADGKRLSREEWRSVGADSEDKEANRTVDKTFDLQESTYWASQPGKGFPHFLVIDLGATQTVVAAEFLPRVDVGAPMAINRYKIYIAEKPFGNRR